MIICVSNTHPVVRWIREEHLSFLSCLHCEWRIQKQKIILKFKVRGRQVEQQQNYTKTSVYKLTQLLQCNQSLIYTVVR